MAQKVRIKRQNVAAFLLNGILHLPSNFKSWNTVHHIPSALKLLSSHCNSRELPRASSLIQLSKNSSDHLKNCWFFPPWTSVLRQKISRLSNYCSINLTAADCPPPTCVSVLQKVISECEAENSFHNKDAISIIICADLCWHIKVSNSINWEALSLALWISHFPKFIRIPAAQLISQSNTCSEIVCVGYMLVKIVVWAFPFLSALPTTDVLEIPQGKTSLLELCVVCIPLHTTESKLPLSSCFTSCCSLQSNSTVITLR